MPEEPYKYLLDRQGVCKDLQEHFQPVLTLLQELTNYGTNLIPRCLVSVEDRKMKEFVVLNTLLHQVVTTLDGFEVLIANGAKEVGILPARVLLEASITIDWILREDAERRSRYYYVANLRKERIWNARTQPDTPEGKAFRAYLSDEQLAARESLITAGKERMAAIDETLVKPEYAPINDAFTKLRKNRKYDPHWYEPLGIRSIAQIADQVGRTREYIVFYNQYSETVHSSTYRTHARIGKGTVTFQPIRHLEELDTLLCVTIGTVLRTYRHILKEYRPGELQNFARKYRDEWQQAFHDIPKVQYDIEPGATIS